VLTEPQWRVRSELGRLLGEHVALAVAALRAGAADSPDFAAAEAAPDGNTHDVTGLVGSLFGEPPRTVLRTLWAEHTNQLVAYAAVAAHDPGRRDATLAALRSLEQRASGSGGYPARARPSPSTPGTATTHQTAPPSVSPLTAAGPARAASHWRRSGACTITCWG
jgi:hypothetical protein